MWIGIHCTSSSSEHTHSTLLSCHQEVYDNVRDRSSAWNGVYALSFTLKIVPIVCNAFLQSGQVTIHCCSELLWLNQGDRVVQGSQKWVHIIEPYSLQAWLDPSEDPVICRAQIWGITWVWHLDNSPLIQLILCWSSSVCGCTIMEKCPGLWSRPILWSSAADLLPEATKDGQVDFCTDPKTMGCGLLVDHSLWIEKDYQHHFGLWDLCARLHWSALISTEPFCSGLLWSRIPGKDPGLILHNNVLHRDWISSPPDHLDCLSALVNSSVFVGLRQIVRDPPSRPLLLLEIFGQDRVSCWLGNVSEGSQMMDSCSPVGVQQILDLCNLVCSSFQNSSRVWFVTDTLITSLEPSPPTMDCWLWKCSLTIDRFQPCFSLHLGQSRSHTKPDVTALLQFQLLHFDEIHLRALNCSEGQHSATLEPICTMKKACQIVVRSAVYSQHSQE